jgi:hypothetical protein
LFETRHPLDGRRRVELLVRDSRRLVGETEGHHFGWGYATVSLSTKKIKGLHENDFIMASKIDRMLDRPAEPA